MLPSVLFPLRHPVAEVVKSNLRYNLGSKLADIFCKLGFVDSSGFGYQTFLHGSETEIRQLLMFLVDKMPRENDEDEEAGISEYVLSCFVSSTMFAKDDQKVS